MDPAIAIIALTILVLLFTLVSFFLKGASFETMPDDVIDNWAHYTPGIQVSAIEFYDAVEKLLKDRAIPDAVISRLELSEHGSLMDRHRTYLRVRNHRNVFDICAAPYGDGFFVSWWLGVSTTLRMKLLFCLPLLGSYYRSRHFPKTYYALDCQDMFEEALHRAVVETLEDATIMKGARALSDIEKLPRSSRKQTTHVPTRR